MTTRRTVARTKAVRATGSRDSWTATKRAKFLRVLEDSGNVTAAAHAAGMSKSSVYQLRARDAEFAKAWDMTLATALDDVEQALIARALNGVEKTKYYRDKKIGVEREYSDTLAMFLLRRHRPRIYADMQTAVGDDADAGAEACALLKKRLAEIAARRLEK
jgi:DNA-binding phage protein